MASAVLPERVSGDASTPTMPKPRWRGVLHSWAAVVAGLAGVPLVVMAWVHRGLGAGIGTLVYACTVVGLFAISATYHRGNWSPTGRARMRRLDHSMIFVFIAGTFTAMSVLALSPSVARNILFVVWVGALVGLLLALELVPAPRWLNVVAYLSLGWAGVFVIPDLTRQVGIAGLALIAAGGAFYSLGAAAYGTRRPRLSPTVFGYHEVFHLCTIIAAICHYIAIWLAIYS
jgi:hemolysin III